MGRELVELIERGEIDAAVFTNADALLAALDEALS
jgi:hypothetical protein